MNPSFGLTAASPYPTATPSLADAPPPAAGARVLRVMQGEWWSGAGQDLRVQTLLGSCVSIVLWQPQERVGGLCHYLLASRRPGSSPLSGRYADEALELMMQGIREHTSAPSETFEAHVFGGADAFKSGPNSALAIGHHNVRRALELVGLHGFRLGQTDTLESVPRTVELDTGHGRVTCRRGTPL